MVFFSLEPTCLRSGRHFSLLWMPEGQEAGWGSWVPGLQVPSRGCAPCTGVTGSSWRNTQVRHCRLCPLWVGACNARGAFASEESLEHHIWMMRSSLNACAGMLGSTRPHFHCCSLHPKQWGCLCSPAVFPQLCFRTAISRESPKMEKKKKKIK